MLSPEDCQIEICLQKINRTLMENTLQGHDGILSTLDADFENKYRQTFTVLREARSLNIETGRLKEENGRLAAKRVVLQQQCAEANDMVQKLRDEHTQLTEMLNKNEIDTYQHMYKHQYEDIMQDITDQFRESATYHNEEVVNEKSAKANEILSELENEEVKFCQKVNDLKSTLEGLKASVPEDILLIVGQKELEKKLNYLNAQCEEFGQKNEVNASIKEKIPTNLLRFRNYDSLFNKYN